MSDSPEIVPAAAGDFAVWVERFQRGFFIAAIAVTALLTALYLFVGDRTWWGEMITVWPSFLWCVGLIPLAAMTLRLRAPGRFLIAVGGIAVFLLLTGEWRSLVRRADPARAAEFDALRNAIGADPAAPVALRLVTWNVADYMSDPEDILATLAALNPDVCLLQETHDGPRSFQPADLTGPWADFQWVDDGDCGVLSRFPIRTLALVPVGDWQPLECLALELPGDRQALLVNVHLAMPALAFDLFFFRGALHHAAWHRMRLAQYPRVMESLAALRAEHGLTSVIVAGDFNIGADVKSLAPLRETLRDVWPLCGRGWGATFMAGAPMARIDHCWVSSDIRPIDAHVARSAVSDHRPLVVDLILPGADAAPP